MDLRWGCDHPRFGWLICLSDLPVASVIGVEGFQLWELRFLELCRALVTLSWRLRFQQGRGFASDRNNDTRLSQLPSSPYVAMTDTYRCHAWTWGCSTVFFLLALCVCLLCPLALDNSLIHIFAHSFPRVLIARQCVEIWNAFFAFCTSKVMLEQVRLDAFLAVLGRAARRLDSLA